MKFFDNEELINNEKAKKDIGLDEEIKEEKEQNDLNIINTNLKDD